MSTPLAVDTLARLGTPSTGAPRTLLDMARQTQTMRATVAAFFPRDIFRDSAWDMMLETFVAGEEGRNLCVKQVILVSGETSTSALRRIDRLEAAGLMARRVDPADHRRVSVTLTVKGHDAMAAMLRSLFVTGDRPVRTGAAPQGFHPAYLPGLSN
ncbi:MarR family transcriptional regulator [Sphingomonas abaci]|uniref:MarR family transcriptional regulator n=1 Tax=Sphingomonas abaci TaxID=237611 RepID=A0A7W7AGF2_9SPHN|nr:MarR family transcriptional regulator [Sphingomonas abaci]MBB4616506.1 hypothetical protein [Sphingomonas abaci]